MYYDGKGLNAPQSPNYAKGKLTKVTSSVSATEYQLFDNLGRMTQMAQITDGHTYTSKYTYNFSGALVEEEYPSGRKVKNEFESDGDISRIFGNATPTATERTYANTFSYTPDGRIEKLRLGNGLWEKAKFNSRLQVTEMAVGNGVNSGNLWKLGYEYGEIGTNGNVDTAKNTGNVARQTLSFNGLTHPFVQTYKYDSLYRLTEARETNNGAQTWKQNFSFDRYGNRLTHDKFAGTTQLSLSVPEHPAIETATNRLSSGQGFTFDANGNLIVDAENRGFTFNGDNKQTVVRNLNITPPPQDPDANVIGRYFYDGEGKRIKKVSATETTVFVYSAGKLIAEYSTATPPSNPTTSWTVTDQLGSPRVIVNSLGQVVSRRDFMPFGEELLPDETYRKTLHKYGQTDSVRQKFTGYQNDTETGLDFAEARMYQNLHGRFTAVDPLLASGKSANPQTFNRYVYVMNSPLLFTDPMGLQAGKWYEPVDENGNVQADREYLYHYPWNDLPSGYRELTRTNRAGQLISDPTDRTHIYRFNPRGPYPETRGVDQVAGWLFYSDYEFQGYDQITSDWFEDLFVEHPADGYMQGSKNVTLDLVLGFSGGPKLANLGGGRFFPRPSNAPSRLAGFGADDAIISSSRNLVPKKGWFDVVAHGTEDGMNFVVNGKLTSPDDLLEMMVKQGYTPGTNIRLMACYSGSCPTGAAAQLSNIAGATVVAPKSWVTVVGRDSIFYSPSQPSLRVGDNEWFRVFRPNTQN